jgi:hypothetical protein
MQSCRWIIYACCYGRRSWQIGISNLRLHVFSLSAERYEKTGEQFRLCFMNRKCVSFCLNSVYYRFMKISLCVKACEIRFASLHLKKSFKNLHNDAVEIDYRLVCIYVLLVSLQTAPLVNVQSPHAPKLAPLKTMLELRKLSLAPGLSRGTRQ